MAKNNKKNSNPEITWNNIDGVMRVYTNELEGSNGKPWYKTSVSVASKDSEGEYHSFYIDLKFAKNVKAPDSEGVHYLEVEGFLTTEYWTDKKTKEERIKPVLLVTECDIIG